MSLELQPNEKVVSVRVSTYSYLPCEVSFMLVTMEPRDMDKTKQLMADAEEEEEDPFAVRTPEGK